MARTHCGLDFGTSNTTFASAGGDGIPRLVPLEGEGLTLPSAMFFSFETDAVSFGRAALAEYIGGGDGRLMRSLKSVLGTSLFGDRTRIKKQMMPFSAVLGMFIAEVKRRAESALGDGIGDIVVGRPVHFVDDDPVADATAQSQLEDAVRQQGFQHIAFQFEPIAAALDYEQRVIGEELGLVIDIGGGTSDFSIIRLSPGGRSRIDRHDDILATAGVHIGGTDFDRLLSMRMAMPQLGYQTLTADGKRPLPSGPYYDLATWHRINRLYVPRTITDLRQTRMEAQYPERVAAMIALIEDRQGHRLAAAVEEAKIALTVAERSDLKFSGRDVSLDVRIGRDDLELALEGAVEKIGGTISEILRRAGVGAAAIETLILTGGSTQVPAVAALLQNRFPQARFVETDAFGSVGLGLALDASRRFA